MARTTGRHEHRWQVISFSLDPKVPRVLYGCKTCISVEARCVLCEEDGNRRRHRKHNPPGDRQLFNMAVLRLTKAAMEYERLWGPWKKANDGEDTAAS